MKLRRRDAKLENLVLFGLHIPKCAGTTFINSCYEKLPPHLFYCNSQPFPFHQNKYPEFVYLDHDNVRLVFGHNNHEELLKMFPKRPVMLFTGLRDPVERVKSQCYFWERFGGEFNKTIKDTLTDYIISQPNRLCSYLVNGFPSFVEDKEASLADRAISVLAKFDLVYDTASFDEHMKIVYGILDIELPTERANTTKREAKFEIPEEVIIENNQDDIQLYGYFRSHPELTPQTMGDLNHRIGTNDLLRKQILSEPVQLMKIYNHIYRRKKNVYMFSNTLDSIIANKIEQLHSLTHELDIYLQPKGKMKSNLSKHQKRLLRQISNRILARVKEEEGNQPPQKEN